MTFARHTLGSLGALVTGILASIVLARALGAEARGEYFLAVKIVGLILAVSQWGMPETLLGYWGARNGVADAGGGENDGADARSSSRAVHGDIGGDNETGGLSAGRTEAGTGAAMGDGLGNRTDEVGQGWDGEAREDRQPTPGALVGTVFGLGLALTGGVGVAVLLGGTFVAGSLLQGVDAALVTIAVLGSVVSIVGVLARRFIQLEGYVDLYNALDFGRSVLFLVAALTLALTMPRQALGAMLAWLLAEVALAVVGVWLVLRRTGWDGMDFEGALARRLMIGGAPLVGGMLAVYLGNEAGGYVLNATLDLAAVGVYAVALSVARLVLQVSMAMRTALQPRLVAPGTDSAQVTAQVTRHGLLWMLGLSAALAVLSPGVPLVFGPEFGSASLVLVLMLPGMVAYGVTQLLAGHLLRLGQQRVLSTGAWVFAVSSVGLQAVGALAAGLLGAAVGLSVAYGLGAVVVVVAFKQASALPLGALWPGRADVAVYPQLGRRILAWRAP